MLKNQTRKLTDALISTFEYQSRPVIIRDSSLNRFGLRISNRTMVFVIQAERKAAAGRPRHSHVCRLGKWPMVRTDEAREAAVKILAQIDRGEEPAKRGQVAQGTGTVATAWAEYRAALEKKVAAGKRSPRTLKAYDDLYRRLLPPVHGEKLAVLSANPIIATRLHAAIAASSGAPSAASAMVLLRAIYRHAALNDPTLSPGQHPVRGAELHQSEAPDNALSAEQLPAWFSRLRLLDNEVRESFHLFSLVTGLRRGDVLSASWANVDLEARTIHLPNPKGGLRRAFTLPLSTPAIDALLRAREAGQALYPRHAGVFCFAGPSGQLRGTDERGKLRTGHALRRTFASQGIAAGIPEEIVSRLLNHASGTQTGAYVNTRAGWPVYAAAMEQIGEHLMKAMVSHK